jgi:branched-subunit amino acid ABC-type transport system permease component
MSTLVSSLSPLTEYFMDNPGLHFAQGGLILFAALVLFLLFFALRDILLRTHSFWYQFCCIVIVTLLPVVGFLIYLLIRPTRTIKERELEAMLLTLTSAKATEQMPAKEEILVVAAPSSVTVPTI